MVHTYITIYITLSKNIKCSYIYLSSQIINSLMEEATSDYPCISSSEKSILGKVFLFLNPHWGYFFIDFPETVEKSGEKKLEISIDCLLTEDWITTQVCTLDPRPFNVQVNTLTTERCQSGLDQYFFNECLCRKG